MPYANDKLEKGFIRKNMSRIAREVKVRDMLLHLPCLTKTDKEEVEAKCTMIGNSYAMSALLENLVRRENWPEEFIRALEECEHPTLAREMREAYEALKPPSYQKQKPASPSADTVTSAHVHPPSSVGSISPKQPLTSFPPQQPAPSAPLPTSSRSALPPSRTTKLPFLSKVAPQAQEALGSTSQLTFAPIMTPDATTCPSMVEPPVNCPSAAPVAKILQSNEAQAPKLSVTPEPDILDGSVSSVPPAEISELPHLPPGPQATFLSHIPKPPKLTKVPIQESSPPSCKENPLQQEPEETSDPTWQQVSTHQQPTASSEETVVHFSPQNTTPSAPVPAAAPVSASTSTVAVIHQRPPSLVNRDMEEEFLSKPGVLQSEVEVVEEPCSVTSSDLELSVRAEGSNQANDGLSAGSSDQIDHLTAANHNRESVNIHNSSNPYSHSAIEDHFESVCSNSLDQGTMEHVIHVSQEPSIQNYDGQVPSLMRNVVSREEKAVVKHDNDTQSETSLQEQQPATNHYNFTTNILESGVHLRNSTEVDVITEKKKKLQKEENKHEEGNGDKKERRKTPLPALLNVPVIATAAAVGICALVFAWKLRN